MQAEIKALIVDDENLAREALRVALSDFGFITIIGEAENGYNAIKMVHEHKPDLIFLDIQMPRLDGFDVVELLGKDIPGVIFVTAHDEYALKAFEAQAVDYLLKPVKKERLAAALDRFRSIKKEAVPEMEKLVEAHHDSVGPLDRLLIRDGAHVFIIPTEEIIYIEAQDDYAEVHTKERSYLKYERMAKLEEQLDPKIFCRIHRSYILNISYLEKIEPYSKDKKIAKLNNGKTLSISKSGHGKLMELF